MTVVAIRLLAREARYDAASLHSYGHHTTGGGADGLTVTLMDRQLRRRSGRWLWEGTMTDGLGTQKYMACVAAIDRFGTDLHTPCCLQITEALRCGPWTIIAEGVTLIARPDDGDAI